jgi:hypothetical protein
VSRPRSLVLLLTILALIYMAANWPRPVEVVEVKYCLQDQYSARREILVMPDGSPVIRDGKLVERWRRYWGKIYDRCALMDRFEFI